MTFENEWFSSDVSSQILEADINVTRIIFFQLFKVSLGLTL